MRQIVIALLNYESAFQKFPSSAAPESRLGNTGGEALYSCRVQLLPYIGMNHVQNKWVREKAWNSPENAELSKQVIPAYGETNRTRFRFPVLYLTDEDAEEARSASSLSPISGMRIGSFSDGSTRSIMLIEAPEAHAIEWANPEPWILDRNNLIQSVFGDRQKVTVGMCDGSVHVLQREKMTEEGLKGLLTRSGGEVVDIQQFK